MAEIAEILMSAVDKGATDILLGPYQVPVIRINGALEPLAGVPLPDPDETKRWIYFLLDDQQKRHFEAHNELDFAFTLRGVGRYRVNVFVQTQGVAAALRFIPLTVPRWEDLYLPTAVANLASLPRGLVLVTGPTGSGKSSTLAAMIDLVNSRQQKHILTIEDPIEFVYQSKSSMITQREVGTHTGSFGKALKYALRQNPDIIMVGEMRDAETISLALSAAETGHLCLSTLHTQDAASTVNRIIDEFPHEQQEKVKTQLCTVLSAVVSQTLLPRLGGGRVCAREVMIMNAAVGSLIRENKISQIYGAIESGSAYGMVSMDQSLANLVRTGQADIADALAKARDPNFLKSLVGMAAAAGAKPAGGFR